jgi:hypothetical protein
MTREQATERNIVVAALKKKRLRNEVPAGQLFAVNGAVRAVARRGLLGSLFGDEPDL